MLPVPWGAARSYLETQSLTAVSPPLKYGAHGRHEDAELVLVGGFDANDVARGDHERANVERGPRAERRHPRGVGLDDLLDGLDKTLLREGGHDQALGGIGHTLGVHVRAETDDGTVGGGVGLKALKDLLAVMEDAGALGQRDAVVGGKAALVPRAVLVVGHVAVIGLAIAKVEVAPVQVLLLNGHGMLLRTRARAFARGGGRRSGAPSRASARCLYTGNKARRKPPSRFCGEVHCTALK